MSRRETIKSIEIEGRERHRELETLYTFSFRAPATGSVTTMKEILAPSEHSIPRTVYSDFLTLPGY